MSEPWGSATDGRSGLLLINSPLESFPPNEKGGIVSIVDRDRPLAMEALQRLLGPGLSQEALGLNSRWIVVLLAKSGAMVMGADSEGQLLDIQCGVTTYRRYAHEIHIDHFIEQELEMRLIAAAQAHALHEVPPCGHA